MKTRMCQCFQCFVFGLFFVFPEPAGGTALDDYVALPDSNYYYVQVGQASFDLSTFTRGYTLELTSQGWRDSTEVDRVLWKHWVTIVVPEWDWLLGFTKDTAMVVIDDGNNTDPAPGIDPAYRGLAAGTRSVIAVVSAVPNQPLQFSDELAPRIEDEIIAYSWDKFLDGGDVRWVVQLPMVKSVVRCMDAVQGFVGNYAVVTKTIDYFVLTGGSKRAWTAWLTAAVDLRVTGLAPIVGDLLNMKRSFPHHWATYGFWAEALAPYEEMGIFDRLATPEGAALLEVVDPFEYVDRLSIPKFIVNSAGDDFFVPDSIQYYIDGLLGETYLRHVPNTDHFLTGAFEDVLSSLVPYYDAFLNGDPRPVYWWWLLDDGSILVQSIDLPKAVNLWQATNPEARDFRLVTIGPAWVSTPLPDLGEGLYVAWVEPPETGWTAFFVELVYESPFQGPDTYDYHFTTEMRILPATLPYEGDWNRDGATDVLDLAVLSEVWLTDNAYMDLVPRRTGDGIVNFRELTLLGRHWLEGSSE
ncbi:MAG: PhoPQ-activated protein PqaA family protein [Planctomycetota bacterium]